VKSSYEHKNEGDIKAKVAKIQKKVRSIDGLWFVVYFFL
jgi:hypothetical protein